MNRLHPATENMVDELAATLKAKLARAEQKYGFVDHWRTDDWEDDCQRELARHVQKGDPLDVAAYAAFCWARGYRTAPVQDDALRTVPDFAFTSEQQALLDSKMPANTVVKTCDLIDVERTVAAVLVDEPLGKLRSRAEAAHDLLNQMMPALATQPATSQEGEAAVCAHGIRAPWQCHDCDAENPPPPGYDPLAATPTPPTLSEDLREAIVRDLSEERKRYNESSPTWRALGFCIDIAEKAALAQVKAS